MSNSELYFLVALLTQTIIGAVFLFAAVSGRTSKVFRTVVLASSVVGAAVMSGGLPSVVNLVAGLGIGACWGGIFTALLDSFRRVLAKLGPDAERYADYLILGVLASVPSLVYLAFESEWLGVTLAILIGILIPLSRAWFVRTDHSSKLSATLAKFIRSTRAQSITTWALGGILVGAAEAAVAASFTPPGLGQAMMLVVGGFWMAVWGGLVGAAIAAIRPRRPNL
jgi:hypothetical protein